MIPRKIILIFLFACLIITYILSTYDTSVLDRGLLAITLGLATLLMFIPFVTKYNKQIKERYMRPTVIFILGYFIVFFQKYYDLLFGLIEETDPVFVNEGLINRSLIISVSALIMFYIGYFLFRYRDKKRKVATRRQAEQKQAEQNPTEQKQTYQKQAFSKHTHREQTYIYRTGPLKILFWIVTALLCMISIKELATGEYSQAYLEKNAGSLGNYMSILYLVVFFTLLTVSVYNCITLKIFNLKGFIRQFGIISLVCLLGYSAIMVLIGRRLDIIVMITGLAIGIAYIKNMKPKLWKLVIALAVVTYIVSIIGIVRKVDDSSSISSKVEAMQYVMLEQKSIIPTTTELAGSLETFNYALDYVPSKHDYLYGSFHVRNIVSTIPFSSHFTANLFDPHWMYRSSDFFITYIIQGENYSYGNGSSINADLYLNYGIPGIIIGLFLLGVIFYRVEYNFCTKSNPKLLSILFFLIFAGYSLPYCRAGYLAPINYIIFCYILVTIYSHHFKKHLKRSVPVNKKAQA